MRYRDEIILKEDIPELNLKKDTRGHIFEPIKIDGKWCISGLRKDDLNMFESYYKEYISEEYLEFVEDPEVVMARSCDDEDIDEADAVELIVDRDEYKREDISSGMWGMVMSSWPARGRWEICFCDESDPYWGVFLSVKGKDLRIIKKHDDNK